MKQKMYREQFLSTSRYNFPSLLYGKSLEVTQIQHTEIEDFSSQAIFAPAQHAFCYDKLKTETYRLTSVL